MFDFGTLARRFTLVAGTLALALLSGCKRAPNAADFAAVSGPDPADVNLAPVDANQPQAYPAQPAPSTAASYRTPARTRVLGQSRQEQPYQQAETYPAPVYRQEPAHAPDPQDYNPPQPASDTNYDTTQYVAEEAPQPPPPLPVYEQPPAPEPDDLWTPGYWSYAPAGYFWVPGAWVAAPYSGALWTPGYWGGDGDRYRFHRGFWGLHIGFYGGIHYGFGYEGSGYRGGYWDHDHFFYNRAVNRVNENVIHNTYIRNETINNTVINNRVSYNGGRGGLEARPAAYEIAAMHEQHTAPMAAQTQLRDQSRQNRQQFFSANQGRPASAVTWHPLNADRNVAPPQVPRGVAATTGFNSNQPQGLQQEHTSFRQGQAQQGQASDQQRALELQQRNQQLQSQPNTVQQPQLHNNMRPGVPQQAQPANRRDLQQRAQQQQEQQRAVEQQQRNQQLQSQPASVQQSQVHNNMRPGVPLQQVQPVNPRDLQQRTQQQEQQRNLEQQRNPQQAVQQQRTQQQQQQVQEQQRRIDQQRSQQQQGEQRVQQQQRQQEQRPSPPQVIRPQPAPVAPPPAARPQAAPTAPTPPPQPVRPQPSPVSPRDNRPR